MRSSLISSAAVLVATTGLTNLVRADNCALGSELVEGNWYCQVVDTIVYSGIGGSGSYNQVTDMDSSSGSCASSQVAYSGNLAPLNEEVSGRLLLLEYRTVLTEPFQLGFFTLPWSFATQTIRSLHP